MASAARSRSGSASKVSAWPSGAGIHTGEIERVDRAARGIAVHLAARVAAKGAAGEVLVTSTTRDLVAGSGLSFADRGEHTLKGVEEPKRLYAAES